MSILNIKNVLNIQVIGMNNQQQMDMYTTQVINQQQQSCDTNSSEKKEFIFAKIKKIFSEIRFINIIIRIANMIMSQSLIKNIQNKISTKRILIIESFKIIFILLISYLSFFILTLGNEKFIMIIACVIAFLYAIFIAGIIFALKNGLLSIESKKNLEQKLLITNNSKYSSNLEKLKLSIKNSINQFLGKIKQLFRKNQEEFQ